MKRFSIKNFIPILFLLILSIILVLLFTYQKSSTKTNSKTDTPLETLICQKTTDSPDDILTTDEPISLVKKLRVIFRGHKFSSIMFSYSSAYDSAEKAAAAESKIHITYNQYVGDHNISVEKYNPNYDIIDSRLEMTLYIEKAQLSEPTSRLFFIDQLSDLNSIEKLKSTYQSKNFDCHKE